MPFVPIFGWFWNIVITVAFIAISYALAPLAHRKKYVPHAVLWWRWLHIHHWAFRSKPRQYHEWRNVGLTWARYNKRTGVVVVCVEECEDFGAKLMAGCRDLFFVDVEAALKYAEANWP